MQQQQQKVKRIKIESTCFTLSTTLILFIMKNTIILTLIQSDVQIIVLPNLLRTCNAITKIYIFFFHYFGKI